MTKKEKKILWHKRRSKLLSAHYLKTSKVNLSPLKKKETPYEDDRTYLLAKKFSEQIKRAVAKDFNKK